MKFVALFVICALMTIQILLIIFFTWRLVLGGDLLSNGIYLAWNIFFFLLNGFINVPLTQQQLRED